MPSTEFTVHTTLSPSDVLSFFTDFGPDRAKRWPNTDEAHFKVHDQGPDWAEVTEGNAMGWEREKYSWDATAGTVTIDTVDSNLWGPGSGWRYRADRGGRRDRRPRDTQTRGEGSPGEAARCPDPGRRGAGARQAVRSRAAEGRVGLRAARRAHASGGRVTTVGHDR